MRIDDYEPEEQFEPVSLEDWISLLFIAVGFVGFCYAVFPSW